jgi:hypothetical protein
MPGFQLARGSVWAGGRDHAPSQVPQRWGTTSCRETAPLTYLFVQVDARIALAERGTGALRGIYQEEAAAVLEMQDEVNVAQSTLQKAANDLAAQHATNIGLRAVRAPLTSRHC